MLADEFPEMGIVSPQTLGGTYMALHLLVDDVDLVWQRALDTGAEVFRPLEDSFWGERAGQVIDPSGTAGPWASTCATSRQRSLYAQQRRCLPPRARMHRKTSNRGRAKACPGPRYASLDGVDRDRLERLVAPVALDRRDPVDDVLSRGDLSEHGVLPVEPGRRFRGDDEELGAVRVRPRIRHRERAALDLVVVELVLEGVPGAAGAGAERTSGLDHEVRDHAVEDQPVVEPVRRELSEVVYRLRRVVGIELHLDVAFAGLESRLGHVPEPTQNTNIQTRKESELLGWRPKRPT